MPGPSKINESDKIVRAVPLLTNLIIHSNPVTGQGFAGTVQELLALVTGTKPVTSFPNEAAMLADTTVPIGYMTYVADSGKTYTYQGPTHDNIASYTLVGSGAEGGGQIGETATATWKFDTNTSTSPTIATGRLRFNNAVAADITEMYLAEMSSDGKDTENFLRSLQPRDSFYIQQKNDASRWVRLIALTEPVENDTWWTVAVDAVESSGTLPANNADTILRATFGSPPVTGGPDKSIQFNDDGAFNGDAFFSYDKLLKAIIIGLTKIVTPGTDNIFWGKNTNDAITSGEQNIGLGNQTFKALTTGLLNIGVGQFAGAATTTGQKNIAIGVETLLQNIAGYNNVAIGYRALRQGNPTDNIAIGIEALYNSASIGNVALGTAALRSLISGARNIAIGIEALYAEQTGQHNIGIGHQALSSQNDGYENIAIGVSAGFLLTIGNYNTLLGGGASGGNLTTGSKNVALGYRTFLPSATANGQLSIQNAIFGVENVAVATDISTGRIGIYVVAPTARLHLPAGQAAANNAPLKFDAGSLLAAIEAGTIEYDGTDFYATTPAGREKLTGRLSPISVAPIGGVLTLDCQGRQEVKFLCTSAITGATSIVFTNAANLIIAHLSAPMTGTNIPLTWPSDSRMSRYNETASGDGWNATSKVLTLSSIGAGDLWEFSYIKMGSIYKINYDGPTRP